MRPAPPDNKAIKEQLEQAVNGLGIYTSSMERPEEPPIAELRRRRGGPTDDPVAMATLLDVEGVLVWEEGVGSFSETAKALGGRRGHPRGGDVPGHVVERTRFDRLAPNQMSGFLESLDLKLTPHHRQLRFYDPGTASLQPCADPGEGRILLLVHGTFSNNDHIIEELKSSAEGQQFLVDASKIYDRIVAFDHPTLSVSPLLNALDLSRVFADAVSKTRVDVICHSRGGLVTRWWMEVFQGDARVEKAVLVGSPLAGTSLAAPPRLRAVANILTNLARAVQYGAGAAAAVTANPLLAIAAGFMRIVTSVSAAVSSTPLFDAAVLLVPGLSAQSRVSNNPELTRLRTRAKYPDYAAICANFEPPPMPVWKFWRYFNYFKQKGIDVAADYLFEADNDLVVDTSCMTDLADKISISKCFTFDASKGVHHLNYFRQPETAQFMRDHLTAKK